MKPSSLPAVPTSTAGRDGAGGSPRQWLRRFLESRHCQLFIAIVILVNAACVGLETSIPVRQSAGPLLDWAGQAALAVFVVEIVLRIAAYGWRFFLSSWNWFDFVIVAVTAWPALPNISVMRTLRILRALRFFSVVPQLRNVVQAMLSAIPSMASILFLLVLWFYVAGVLATRFFGAAFDEWFGTIGRSMYSLFQIMTLESWSMGIVRPVMKEFAWAWAFFVPFIIFTTFTMLNLFIAVLVSATQSQQAAEDKAAELAKPPEPDAAPALAQQIQLLRAEIADLRQSLRPARPDAP